MSDENKAVVRRHLEEGWGAGNLAVLDAIIGPQAVHEYFRDYPPGPEGFRQAIIGPRRTFPDLRIVIEAMVAEGEMVATRYVWHGMDTGGFPGMPPTGRRVVVPATDFDCVVNGRIVAHWTVLDELGLRQQLGMQA